MRHWILLALLGGCSSSEPEASRPVLASAQAPARSSLPTASENQANSGTAPPYQQRWGGFKVRRGDDLVDAPEADVAVAKGYANWPDKGRTFDGVRLTLMTARTKYAVGEKVRVLHVLDAPSPGKDVYVMGPKIPWGEMLDGKLVTHAPEIPTYPWVGNYDGVTLPSPAIDYNDDVTEYHFASPGAHTLVWKLGAGESNTVHLQID